MVEVLFSDLLLAKCPESTDLIWWARYNPATLDSTVFANNSTCCLNPEGEIVLIG